MFGVATSFPVEFAQRIFPSFFWEGFPLNLRQPKKDAPFVVPWPLGMCGEQGALGFQGFVHPPQAHAHVGLDEGN